METKKNIKDIDIATTTYGVPTTSLDYTFKNDIKVNSEKIVKVQNELEEVKQTVRDLNLLFIAKLGMITARDRKWFNTIKKWFAIVVGLELVDIAIELANIFIP